MVNINGKEWSKLVPKDIEEMLSEQDREESFFFEFKDDRTSPAKVMEEISAFANTFGGYVFLGVNDNKQIEGCTNWDEQRIHTSIHDSLTPTPSFDVKRFSCTGGIVYVIKIDEGAEPPYITSKGKIYERLSSGSFPIKDSVRLSQIYTKREQLLSKIEEKLSIPPIDQNINNIYGYIDIGFALFHSDRQMAVDIFRKADLYEIAQRIKDNKNDFSLSRIGNSYIYIPSAVTSENGYLPAHAHNFLEIMGDGSAKMRILLSNNNPNDSSVNMVYAVSILGWYQDMYTHIMADLFPNVAIYAKCYEKLTVLKQFQPVFYYDENILQNSPELRSRSEKYITQINKSRKIIGITTAVTNDRIPKTGLYTIDRKQIEASGMEYNVKSIIDSLFYSQFIHLGNTALQGMLGNEE